MKLGNDKAVRMMWFGALRPCPRIRAGEGVSGLVIQPAFTVREGVTSSVLFAVGGAGMLPLCFPYLERTLLFGLSKSLVWIVVAVLVIATTRGRLPYPHETVLPAPLTDWEQKQGEARMFVTKLPPAVKATS